MLFVDQIYSIAGGRFSPDIAKYINLCRKAKHREYKCQQHIYYTNLLKEILINRQVNWKHTMYT